MTRLEALKELAKKVEAGGENRFAHHFLDEVRAWRSPLEYFEITNLVHRAYHGSLDAAKALHEAVLPGWFVADMSELPKRGDWVVSLVKRGALVDTDRPVSAVAKCSALAWLSAILSALIAQEESA